MKYGITAVIFVLGFGMSADVAAHAEAPLARKVAQFADGGWLLRTNFGVVSSQAPDRFVCEEAFLGGDRFFVAPLGPDQYVTFGETTIQRTTDGCEFERVGEVTGRVEDVDSSPADQAVAYVANGGDSPGVYISTDAGATFAPLSVIDTERFQLTTVRFAEPGTLVVGAYDRNAEGAAALFSIDAETGVATPLNLPENLTYPYVIAAGSGRVVFNARSMVQTVFVGTLDEPALHARPQQDGESWPTGAAVSSDGSRIYLAGMVLGRGLLVADWNDTELVWNSAIDGEPAGCVNDTDGTILVCSGVAAGGTGDLVSLADDATTSVVTFSEIAGPRDDCAPESDVATVCPLVWPEVAPALGVEGFEDEAQDAGTSSGTDAGDTQGGPVDQTDDSACSSIGASPSLFAFFALLFAVRLRRRTSHD